MNLIESIPNKEIYALYSEKENMYFLPMRGSGRQFYMSTNLNEFLGGKIERYGVFHLHEILDLKTGSMENKQVIAIRDVGNQIEIRKVEI